MLKKFLKFLGIVGLTIGLLIFSLVAYLTYAFFAFKLEISEDKFDLSFPGFSLKVSGDDEVVIKGPFS